MSKSINTKFVIEALGVLGVIGSLIFVGVEINQNSSVARADAYQSYIDGLTNFSLTIASDGELAVILQRANAGEPLSSFSEEELARLRMLFFATIRQWEGIFRSVNDGILPEETLSSIAGQEQLLNASFRELWPSMSRSFTDDFVSFMENERLNHR